MHGRRRRMHAPPQTMHARRRSMHAQPRRMHARRRRMHERWQTVCLATPLSADLLEGECVITDQH